MNIINWLNAEEQPIILQRDDVFALITWRDFNAPAAPVLTFRMALGLFLLAVALPMVVLV